MAEWRRLALVVTGREAESAQAAPPAPRTVIERARRQRGEAVFAAAIGRGDPLEAATVEAARLLVGPEAWHAAWSICEGVRRLPGGEAAAAMGHAVILRLRGQPVRAWARAASVDDGVLRAWIPLEAVDTALADGSRSARERARAVGAPGPDLAPEIVVELAGRFIAAGERDAAAGLVAELRARPAVELDDGRRHTWRLIEDWLAQAPVTVPAGAIPIGLFDYRSPDPALADGNVGDYVQTLAMLGNLVRLRGTTITGEGGLGELAVGLRDRVRPDLAVQGAGGAAHLVPIDRDFSSACSIPEGTWLPAFGWHMQPLFKIGYDFPYHPNVRPLFLSFHVSHHDLLTEEALDYLRRYGPVGCRDWTTVFLLLSAGVDAFFTGCLSTTVDALFPRRAEAFRGGDTVGVIDQPRQAAGDARRVSTFNHQSGEFRFVALADGIRAAEARLRDYQATLSRVVTRRLHAYLPLTSLGVPVEFRITNPGDERFAGLTGLTPDDPALASMRDGLRELTAAIFSKILAGAPEADVYRAWAELVAPRVAEAKALFAVPGTEIRTTTDVEAAVRTSWAGARQFGPQAAVDPATVAEVVLAFDANLTSAAPVVVQSIVEHTTTPLRLWILARGLSDAYQAWFGAAFPDLPVTFLPCDGVAYGQPGRELRIPPRITVSTMDRLLLPHLLPDVRRVVYLDVDTLVLGDVGELFRLDLGGCAIAARDSVVTEDTEWQRCGRPLPEPVAMDLRRQLGALHGFGHIGLNAGVLVMDLERLRRDDFTRTYLGWMEQYGFHDQDTILAYTGPDRFVLPPRWNAMPATEELDDPALIHWAADPKPWGDGLAYERDRWQATSARLRERAGVPPGEPGA